MKKLTTWIYEFGSLEVEVEGIYRPGSPDIGPSFECAGGYPCDPEEIELHHVWVKGNGHDIDILQALTSKQVEEIEEELLESERES